MGKARKEWPLENKLKWLGGKKQVKENTAASNEPDKLLGENDYGDNLHVKQLHLNHLVPEWPKEGINLYIALEKH